MKRSNSDGFLSAGIVMLLLAILVLVLSALGGCAESRDSVKPAVAVNAATLHGTPVYMPPWVPSDLAAEALREIDAAGIPAGWCVVITVPVFEEPDSPTGLARGSCDYERRVLTVGWRARPWEERPLLPALLHERDHILYGPDFGH